ncbi:sigma-70 family RNA polymerase sigma factor [Streptomyces sp. HUAS TT20]|uniref:sigma-70 family RNA polymerase sigma factor n=1 Tax=Streptomyces sp. HUAS TT20 TaxID=3447509 RepID=UPI0021D91336|nr:sigma-70 family RNA polymerase sigma factor [Streptomyces sp. HUAS 15-9]UXY31086.1 sigma-70 family RNA polymerase sigma factor [Streptomyces sp. HUAS 15-9]
MRHQAVGAQGAPVTRAALAELLVQLRRAAVNGVVPEGAFMAQVRKLGLGDAERERLRAELARLGVPVQKTVVHTDVDRPNAEKVARNRVENVFPRADVVLALLGRYADAEGRVTPRALDGVVRLAGLNTREAAALRAAAKVRGVEGAGEEGPDEGGAPPPEPPGVVVPEDGDFAAAVVAGMSVLEEDRFRRRTEHHLLTAEAEVGLTVLLRGGADQVGQEPTDADLSALPPGDLRIRARDCLVLHNLRLVHSVVRAYLEQGLEYDDLVQHGVLGLMRAARKFDPTMGNKFSTYATWWIRQSITRGIADEGALIRIPVHMHEQMRKVAAAERALAAQGRAAGAADVAVHCDMSVRKVEEIRKLSRRTDSLDRVIGDGAILGDLLGEAHALPSVEHGVLDALLMDDVMSVVDTFDERSARVLVRRLGLDGDELSTLDELGREFGVTRERIRQVESKTLPVFRQRLRMAGVTGAFRDGDGQGADEDGEQGRSKRRRARGRAPAAAAVTRPGPDAEREAGTEALPAPAPAVADPSPPPVVEADVLPADWDRALRMLARFEGGIDWLAECALLALGQSQLTVMLGPPAAADVVRAAGEGTAPDQQVLAALEVLQRVFDTLRKAGYRPEDFFERPAEALVEATPRTYLARKPLVNTESRLAVRDALREFTAKMPPRKPAASAGDAHGGSVDVSPSDGGRVMEAAASSFAESVGGVGGGSVGVCSSDDGGVAEPGVPSLAAAAEYVHGCPVSVCPSDDGRVEVAEVSLVESVGGVGGGSVGVCSSDGDRVVVPGAVSSAGRARGERVGEPAAVSSAEPAEAEHGGLVSVCPSGDGRVVEAAASSLAEAAEDVDGRSMSACSSGDEQVAEPGVAAGDVHGRSVSVCSSDDDRVPEPAAVSDDAPLPVPGPAADEEAPPQPIEADGDDKPAPQPAASEEELARFRADADLRLAEVRREYEVRIARVRDEHQQRLAAEREAAEVEAGRQLDVLEEAFLRRVDTSLVRRERSVRAECDERLAQVEEEHRAALQEAVRRGEHADFYRQRVGEADRRLRQYREDTEARIADLEARLRRAESLLAERDHALRAARQQVEAVEQRAAEHIAQTEHNAWARITELQEQLAAERAGGTPRTSLRDRWRRP